ncbi:hypothetical protein [Owenweeksia hongkongensis]|uniref:hypothetical protein n=1 Tax=Owenweeksia hongkongensis TaxID=253245 RepID=UPI003A9042D3
MALWQSIKKSVKTNARTLEYILNDVGNAVAFIPEIIGTTCLDGLYWLGNKIGAKPLFSWLGNVLKNSCSILGAIIKGVFGISAGLLGASIKIVGGILTGQGPVILRGLWDLASPAIGTIILVIGKLIALVQSIFYLQGFERPLNADEKAELKKIFLRGMDLYLIRIITGHAGIFDATPRAFTLGNTLYLKTDSFPTSLLVHECSHSWQYHHTGNRYTADAFGAQWFVDDAYNWFKEIENRHKTDWLDFNPEAQAEFLEDTWRYGSLVDKNGQLIDYSKGSYYLADGKTTFGKFNSSGKDLSDIANNAIRQIRKSW